MTTSDFDMPRLRALYEDLRMKHSRLMGVREADMRRKAELEKKVALAKGRLQMVDEINSVLEALQMKAHRRSLGVYEDLLSACVQDVFPEKGRVELELGKDRGMPALDLFIKNGPNNLYREDILTANGGSINNVVVAGLKVSALTRTENRRLLVLDEPDNWLKPERVPNFMKMLSDAANQANTQMLVISHHGAEFFEGHANIVKLYQEEGVNKATVLEPRMSDWPDNVTPGLRFMRLINVRAHKDTFIPFFPHMNGFIGDNDLGKSTALVTGMRAVAYNDSDDSLFPHPETEGGEQPAESKIIIGLEEDKRIEFTRHLKKSPKVMYRIFQGDELLFEGRPLIRGQAPEEVTKLLGIQKVDGMDIQLVSQKSPIFLLDEVPSVRAQLLSVGQESGHLDSVWELYRKMHTTDRETVKDGESELTRLSGRLPILDRLVPLAATIAILSKLVVNIETSERQDKVLEKILTTLTEAKSGMELSKKRMEVLGKLPRQAPVLVDNSRLATVIAKLEVSAPKAGLKLADLTTKVPALENLDKLRTTIVRLEASAPKAALKLSPLTLKAPVVEDLGKLRTTIERLETLQKKQDTVLPPLKLLVPQVVDNARLLEVGKRLSGLKRTIDTLSGLTALTVKIPELVSSDALARRVGELDKLQKAELDFAAQLRVAIEEESAQEAEKNKLKAQLGDFCPLCEGKLPEEGLVHVHAH